MGSVIKPNELYPLADALLADFRMLGPEVIRGDMRHVQPLGDLGVSIPLHFKVISSVIQDDGFGVGVLFNGPGDLLIAAGHDFQTGDFDIYFFDKSTMPSMVLVNLFERNKCNTLLEGVALLGDPVVAFTRAEKEDIWSELVLE